MTQQQYRSSGLAGIAGAALFIFVFVFVGVIVGTDTSIAGFPAIRAGRTIENGLYLAVLVLWIAPFLAVRSALSESRPVLARYGGTLGVVAVGILAAGALPHVASVPIADLHYAADATAADRVALTAAWQANQAILNMLLVTGLAIAPIGVIGLGLGMLRSPAFGTGLGRVSVALGVIGLAAAVVLLADPMSPVAVLGFFALIAFHLAVGWRLYSLSRSAVAESAWPAAVTGRSAG